MGKKVENKSRFMSVGNEERKQYKTKNIKDSRKIVYDDSEKDRLTHPNEMCVQHNARAEANLEGIENLWSRE